MINFLINFLIFLVFLAYLGYERHLFELPHPMRLNRIWLAGFAPGNGERHSNGRNRDGALAGRHRNGGAVGTQEATEARSPIWDVRILARTQRKS